MKHWIRLLVVMAMVPLLYTCGTTWTYNPKWRSQDVRPDFIFGKDAIEVTLRSDPRLNLYEDEPHALRVCVYQLDSPRAYNQLAGQSKGLMTLLSCNLFDGSVISARAVTVHPGKNERVLIDRVDETQYIGIVAGYQKLEEKRISRRIDIPVYSAKQSSGCSSTMVAKPGNLGIEIQLGAEQIESVTEYAQLPGVTERTLTGRSR